MNTPAHVIFAAAAFAQPHDKRLTTAALAGGLLPDLSLYFMVFWKRFVQDQSFQQIFETAYFSPFWQAVFAIDNSIFVWTGILILGAVLKQPWLMVLAGAGLLHLAFDFPLHHDDGRAHFWPLSNWIFESPISYWDPRHFGSLAGAAEGLTCLGLLIVLWRRFRSGLSRTMILFAGALELAPAFVFPMLFG